jgi:hypothetical protein
MKSLTEIQDQIESYRIEIEEIVRVKEHCASMKWWGVVAELKKVENIRNRVKRLLESLIA